MTGIYMFELRGVVKKLERSISVFGEVTEEELERLSGGYVVCVQFENEQVARINVAENPYSLAVGTEVMVGGTDGGPSGRIYALVYPLNILNEEVIDEED